MLSESIVCLQLLGVHVASRSLSGYGGSTSFRKLADSFTLLTDNFHQLQQWNACSLQGHSQAWSSAISREVYWKGGAKVSLWGGYLVNNQAGDKEGGPDIGEAWWVCKATFTRRSPCQCTLIINRGQSQGYNRAETRIFARFCWFLQVLPCSREQAVGKRGLWQKTADHSCRKPQGAAGIHRKPLIVISPLDRLGLSL